LIFSGLSRAIARRAEQMQSAPVSGRMLRDGRV